MAFRRWNYSSRSHASASNTKHRFPLTNAGVCSRHHPAALGSTSSNISTAAFAFTLKPVSFMPLPKTSAQSWRKALLGPLKTPSPHQLRCRSTANGNDKPIQASRTQSGASPIGRRTILIRIGQVSHPMRTTANVIVSGTAGFTLHKAISCDQCQAGICRSRLRPKLVSPARTGAPTLVIPAKAGIQSDLALCRAGSPPSRG